MYIIASETTPYNEITVFETNELFGRTGRYRCLRFADEAVQGALDLRDPARVVLEYPQALLHLMMRNNPSFERVFMIGHGIGTIPAHCPGRVFTVAEIDERVADVSREHFGYALDNIVVGDGRDVLSRQQEASFDYIILDAFTREGTPSHLTTLEFMRLARRMLRTHGMLLMNLAGKAGRDQRSASIHTTLGEAFRHTSAYFLPESPGSNVGNLLLAGCDRPVSADPREMAGFRERTLERGFVLADKR